MSDVQELINRMSPSEKRYFKLTYSYFDVKKSQTMQLFDDYCSKPNKKESGLKINYLNHILREQILSSLVSFQKNTSPSLRLSQQLIHVSILFDKGLFIQALKQAKKGKKQAQELDDLLSELQFISREKMINKELFDKSEFNEQIQSSFYQEKVLLKKYEQRVTFRHKELFTTFIARTLGFEKSEAAKIQFSELKLFLKHNSYEECSTFHSQCMFLYIQALYHVYRKDFESALGCQLKIVKGFEGRQRLMEANLPAYIGSVYNTCVTYLYLKDFENVKVYFKRLDSFRKKSNMRLVESKLFNYLGMEIALYNGLGEFGRVSKFAKMVSLGMEKFSKEIHITAKLFIYFQLAYAYYGNGEHILSKNRINQVLFDEEVSSFPRVAIQAQLLLLFIQFEKGELNNAQERARTILKLNIKDIIKYPKLHLLLTYFESEKNSMNKSNLHRIKIKIQKLIEKEKSENIITDINLIVWIDAMINKTSYKFEMNARLSYLTISKSI